MKFTLEKDKKDTVEFSCQITETDGDFVVYANDARVLWISHLDGMLYRAYNGALRDTPLRLVPGSNKIEVAQ